MSIKLAPFINKYFIKERGKKNLKLLKRTQDIFNVLYYFCKIFAKRKMLLIRINKFM